VRLYHARLYAIHGGIELVYASDLRWSDTAFACCPANFHPYRAHRTRARGALGSSV